MKKLTKFISLFSIIIFCLFLMFHIFLNIFIKSKEVKVDETELLNKTTVFLTDRQIEIASYILNNQYGLENGSQYYFQKNYKNLTEKEFVSLCLLVKNPIFYDLSKERNSEEYERIYQKINE